MVFVQEVGAGKTARTAHALRTAVGKGGTGSGPARRAPGPALTREQGVSVCRAPL